jgi:WD40 repeat protein/tetratricopeptide (TPR) repeat protein
MVPFDVYHKWLGIPPSEQPPNQYRLLGVSLFESDPEVIDAAANRQMSYVQGFANSEHAAASQAMLNELSEARLCLLDPWKKSVYDETMGRPLAQSTLAHQTPRQTLARIEIGPAELGLLMRQAKEAHVQSRWDVVIDMTSQVIRNDPKRVGAYLLRAEALRRQNRADRALADLAVAIRLDPQSPHPHVIRAGIFKKQVQFDQAIAEATQAIFLDSNSSAAYAIRCECRSLIGDQEGASQDADELFRLDPTRQVGSAPIDVQEVRSRKPVGEVRTHLARSRRLFENASDIFADDRPVDRSLNLRKPVSADEVAETLVDVSDYRPEVMPSPLRRYRPVRRIRRSSAFTVGILCAGVGLLGGVIWYANVEGPSKTPDSDSNVVESSDPQSQKDAGTVEDGGRQVGSPVRKHYPSDAVPFEDRYFKVVWDELSWPEAEEACRRMGGRLACPEKETQQNFLAHLKGEGKVVWIGSYRNRFNQWQWLCGRPIETSRIGGYQGGFNYVAFTIHSDLNCRTRSGHAPGYAVDQVQGYICEWDADSDEARSFQRFDLAESEPVGEICRFSGHSDNVTCVAVSPDCRFAVSGSNDKTVRLWELRSGREVWRSDDFTMNLLAVAFNGDGRTVLACDQRTLKRLDALTGRTSKSRSIDVTGTVRFSSDTSLLVGHDRGKVLIFETVVDQPPDSFEAWTPSFAFSPDNQRIIIGGNEGSGDQEMRDIRTGQTVERFTGSNDRTCALDASPDGRLLAAGSGVNKPELQAPENTVRIWDLRNGRIERQFGPLGGWLWAVAFSPDSRRLLTGGGGRPTDWFGYNKGADTGIQLWDITSGSQVHRFEGHKNGVLCIQYSSDGRYFLSGSSDNTMRLWRLPE